MLVAVAGAVVAAVVFLDMPTDEVPLLLQLLITSAAISLAAGGLFIWISQERSWNRISTRLIGAHVVGILVVLINVGVTAAAMMISTHDLSLLGLLLGYSVAIAAIYSAFVSAWISESLKTISSAARQMAAGDLSVRVPESGERELEDLALSFNMMAGRLQAAFHRQRELEEARQGLIAAVSHDLRTPLASLRVMVEAIADGVASDPETVRRYVHSMQRETISLGKLVDDLFEISRLDAGQVTLRSGAERDQHPGAGNLRIDECPGDCTWRHLAAKGEFWHRSGARRSGPDSACAVQPGPERYPPHAIRRLRGRRSARSRS